MQGDQSSHRIFNKKVLLRERKRHTAHHVASARYAALCNGGRGYPISGRGYPISGKGYPVQCLGRGGYPIPGVGGYPISGLGRGVPQVQTWDGVPPHLRWGTPPDLRWGLPGNLGTLPTRTWDGVPPPHLDLGRGMYPPPASVDKLKI